MKNAIKQTVLNRIKQSGPVGQEYLASVVAMKHQINMEQAKKETKDALKTLMYKDKCIEVYQMVYDINEAPGYVYNKSEE